MDALHRAIQSLDRDGFIARCNYSCCQTCGVAEISQEAAAQSPSPQFYVFWHEQDEEGRLRHGTVYLSYGSLDGEADARANREAGEKIVARLRELGVPVTWKGNPGTRILAG